MREWLLDEVQFSAKAGGDRQSDHKWNYRRINYEPRPRESVHSGRWCVGSSRWNDGFGMDQREKF